MSKKKISKRLKEYTREFKKQRREHPKLPTWAVRQIAKDHIKKGINEC